MKNRSKAPPTEPIPAFLPGSVVRLRSSDRQMTIVGIESEGDDRRYRCVWFADGHHHTDLFPPDLLEATNS